MAEQKQPWPKTGIQETMTRPGPPLIAVAATLRVAPPRS